jgi:hypothetical protein
MTPLVGEKFDDKMAPIPSLDIGNSSTRSFPFLLDILGEATLHLVEGQRN